MSRQNPWSGHYQSVWHERAGDVRLPYWLRVAALAYGSHKANGHATFNPGDVALVLGTPEASMSRMNVKRAIDKAIEYGWLRAGSTSLCLMVPSYAITLGLGNPRSACRVHGSTQ